MVRLMIKTEIDRYKETINAGFKIEGNIWKIMILVISLCKKVKVAVVIRIAK